MIAAPWLVSAVAPGFDLESQALTVSLTRVMLLSIFVGAGAGISDTTFFTATATSRFPGVAASRQPHAHRRRADAHRDARHPGTRVRRRAGQRGARGSCMWPAVWRLRKSLRLRVDFTHPMFLGVMRLALPLFIGMAGAKLDDVIDRIFASMLAEGSISGLSYALRLIELPREILVGAFSAVLFPLFSRLAARGQMRRVGRQAHHVDAARVLRAAARLGGHGPARRTVRPADLPARSLRRGVGRYTVSALLLYTPTIWALGLTSIMAAGFIAMKNTKTPVIAGLVRLVFKVGLVFALIGTFQHAGIALATSVSHVFKLALFFIVLPPVIRRGRYRELFRAFGGTALATAVMAAALFFLARGLSGMEVPDSILMRAGVLVGSALVGVVFYAAAARFVCGNELREAVHAARSGFKEILGKRRAK